MIYHWMAFFLAAYLLASIPFGKVIAGKVAGIDITTRGSGNIGATNVSRELGIKWGLLTLILDCLKGFLPVFLAWWYLWHPDIMSSWALSATGVAALLGHQFPLFQRFKGGKGVATALGVYLAISPLPCVIAVLVFVLVVYKWDYVSLGSMVSAFSVPVLVTLFGKPFPISIGALVISSLIFVKHRDNITRLAHGQEHPWRKKTINQISPGAGQAPRPNRSKS